jgi:hypothetical protein
MKPQKSQTNSKDNSLIEIGSLPGKVCQNDQYPWHKYPKTRLKDSPYPDSKQTLQTFVVLIKKTNTAGIFCYHCFLAYIGKCIQDLRDAGATQQEIEQWIIVKPNEGAN